MNDKINSARLSTFILVEYYKKLIDLACNFLDESDEFKELIDKINNAIRVENEMYENISLDEINKCLDDIKDIKIADDLIARYYSKLNYQKRIKDGGKVIDDRILLSALISAKISIDLLKILENMINNLETNEKIDENDIYMLKMHHINNKYLYFTSNNFLERYAIEYNFDINKIPAISFRDIEEKFNVSFINNIGIIFTNYVIDSMNEIKNLKSDNKYYLSYKSMMELARVEAILPYLDIKAIKNIEDKYDYKNDTDITIRAIKKKIKKRKEELTQD